MKHPKPGKRKPKLNGPADIQRLTDGSGLEIGPERSAPLISVIFQPGSSVSLDQAKPGGR